VSTLLPEANWQRLFRIACRHIRQANSRSEVIDWTFGGGTALMLHINHRESHDIDIFLPGPQLLPLLDPEKHDFEFELQPDGYTGDCVRSLRLVFENLGRIDFIVAGALSSSLGRTGHH
jgi:Nucleotidyl transferase AbiEii toxin, Type IV TA system